MMNVRCVGEADERKVSLDSIYSHGKFRAIELNIEVVCKEFYALQRILCPTSCRGNYAYAIWQTQP